MGPASALPQAQASPGHACRWQAELGMLEGRTVIATAADPQPPPPTALSQQRHWAFPQWVLKDGAVASVQEMSTFSIKDGIMVSCCCSDN